jgi:hypothetical protein
MGYRGVKGQRCSAPTDAIDDPKAALHPFNQPRALAMRLPSAMLVPRWPLFISFYATRFMPGGCHVPSPGGKIEGASVFGQ